MPQYLDVEKYKYRNLYGEGTLGKSYQARHGEGYGRGLWGGGVIDFIKDLKLDSICDVGCGAGRFCNIVSEFIPKVFGTDIASVITGSVIPNAKVIFLDGEAKSIPLESKSVDYVTSFDCLEHCPPEDIDNIVRELYRVAKTGLIISVSSLEDSHDGVILHLTVESQEWWIAKFNQHGDVEVTEFGIVPDTKVPYLHVVFKK